MTINRRNILLGLGAIVGGGGALVGTGAFSTVSAARSVSVSTAGDASAFLQLTSSSAYVADDTSTGTLELTLDSNGQDGSTDSGFNENAVTTTTDAFRIANNAADGSSVTVGLSSSDPGDAPDGTSTSGTATVTVLGGSGEDVDVSFYLGTANDDSDGNNVGTSPGTVTLSPGDYVDVDVEVDTTATSSNASTSGSLYIVGV